ncbi:MAG: hypothetical protein JXA08_04500 [Methanomicrobiaceae archaeon]|nr:hypothetical protein [Methanomicrobiaceae archaeon]
MCILGYVGDSSAVPGFAGLVIGAMVDGLITTPGTSQGIGEYPPLSHAIL